MGSLKIEHISTSRQAAAFARRIASDEVRTYFLQGSWGSGKSEYLRAVKESGPLKGLTFVELELWKPKDKQSLASKIFSVTNPRWAKALTVLGWLFIGLAVIGSTVLAVQSIVPWLRVWMAGIVLLTGNKGETESGDGEPNAEQPKVVKELDDFLEPFKLTEKYKTKEKTEKLKLDQKIASEDPDIQKIQSPIKVVVKSCLLLVVGFALKIFSQVPYGLESWTPWLSGGGILVSAGATVFAAYKGWQCKKYLAMVQLKIDALDIWEKYRKLEENEKSSIRDRRTSYLLKKAYINTITWGLSGVTIVAALISVLITNV